MDNDSKRADASLKTAAAAERRAGAAEAKASGSGSSGSLAKERLEVTKGRERRVDIDQQIKSLQTNVDLGLIDKKQAKVELLRLEGLRNKYRKIEDSEDAPAAKPADKTAAPAATETWVRDANGKLVKAGK